MPYYPAVRAGLYAHSLPNTPRTGRWYSFPHPTAATSTNLSVTTVAVFFSVPIYVPRTPANPLASVNIRVATATSGATVRAAWYSADPDTQEPIGAPTDLGSIDAGTAGAKPYGTVPAISGGSFYTLAITAVGSSVPVAGTQGQFLPMIVAPTGAAIVGGAFQLATTLGAGGAFPTNPGVSSVSATAFRVDLAF